MSGTNVPSCESAMKRVRAGRVLSVAAIAASAGMLVAGCSPEVGFPAIHDVPPPRSDTPLTPDQVKQATDDLISARNKLSTGTQNAAPANASPNAPANVRPAKPPSSAQQPAVQAAAQAPAAANSKP